MMSILAVISTNMQAVINQQGSITMPVTVNDGDAPTTFVVPDKPVE